MQVRALRIKAQLFAGAERAMGPGRAELLAAIAAEGSISAAGRALGMSYRRAWLLVDSMNRCFTERLVDTAATGAPRGARLSEAGQRALAAYMALEGELARVADGPALAEIESLLRVEPIPARSNAPPPEIPTN